MTACACGCSGNGLTPAWFQTLKRSVAKGCDVQREVRGLAVTKKPTRGRDRAWRG